MHGENVPAEGYKDSPVNGTSASDCRWMSGGCLVDHPIRTITWNPRVGEQAYSIFLILAS
jgi:hypothetical protein